MTWPSLLVQNRLLIINNCCFGFSFPAVTEQSFQCWYLTCGILTWFVRYPPPHLPYEMPVRFLIREYGADSYPVVFIDWVACVMLVVPVNNLSQEFHPGAGVIQRLLEMTLVIVDWKKNWFKTWDSRDQQRFWKQILHFLYFSVQHPQLKTSKMYRRINW